jgi:hypothetical protein
MIWFWRRGLGIPRGIERLVLLKGKTGRRIDMEILAVAMLFIGIAMQAVAFVIDLLMEIVRGFTGHD